MSTLFLLPLLPLCITLLNFATWTRGFPHRCSPRMSVLIPARNEAQRIGPCLQSLLLSELQPFEILVYDDHSSDNTAEVVLAHARENPKIRLIKGGPLPGGWVGKPRACARLAEEASGEWLLFVDADVRLEPGGLGRVAGLLGRADVVTAVPRQESGSLGEHLVLPWLLLTYLSWLPLFLVEWSRSPRFLAANGQILGIRAEALRKIGGFAAVRNAVVDDMALCRLAKQQGLRVCFADGFWMGTCRMYQSFAEVRAGFSKNLALGIGSNIGTLLVMALYFLCFFAPFMGALWWEEARVGALLVLLQRSLVAIRYRQSFIAVLLHPLGVLALLSIAFSSLKAVWRGQIVWRERAYDAQEVRG